MEEEGYFFLKNATCSGLAGGTEMRILSDSSYIDLPVLSSPGFFPEEDSYRCKIPGEIKIHFARKQIRVNPSKNSPVKIRFRQKSLRAVETLITVTDISMGGIGFELSDAESIFRIGTILDTMNVLLPGEGDFTVSGQVKFSHRNRCGIEFLRNSSPDFEKLNNYINQRQIIDNIYLKTYRNIERGLRLEKELQSDQKETAVKNSFPPCELHDAPGRDIANSCVRKRILIVDGSTVELDKFSLLLRENNYEVLTATDGLQGIRKALEYSPDLILLDLNIPHLNGIECAQIIKNQPSTRSIPVCMFTSAVEKELVLKAANIGVNDLIIKTLEPEHILNRIGQMLEKQEGAELFGPSRPVR
jgi:CheY-like chemotaxis protein